LPPASFDIICSTDKDGNQG